MASGSGQNPNPFPSHPKGGRTKSQAVKPAFQRTTRDAPSDPIRPPSPRPTNPASGSSSKTKAPTTGEEAPPATGVPSTTPTRLDIQRWLRRPTHIDRFVAHFQQRTVVDPIWFNLDWFLTNEFPFLSHLLEAELTDFICLKEPVYPMLTRVFYSTLSYENDILKAEVKGVKIRITHDLWSQLTGLKWVGEETTGTLIPPSWSEEYTPEAAHGKICHCNAVLRGKTLQTGNLTVTSRLLHFVISKIILARNSNFSTVFHDDRILLWALLMSKPVNWAFVVLHHMLRNKESTTLPLPYAMLVTKILRHFKVPLKNEEVFQIDKWQYELGSRTVSMAKIRRIDDTWLFPEHGHNSNLPMSDFPDAHVPPSARQPVPPSGPSSSSAPATHDSTIDHIRQLLAEHRTYINQRQQQQQEAFFQHVDNSLTQQREILMQHVDHRLHQQYADLIQHIDHRFDQQQQYLETQFNHLRPPPPPGSPFDEATLRALISSPMDHPPFPPP